MLMQRMKMLHYNMSCGAAKCVHKREREREKEREREREREKRERERERDRYHYFLPTTSYAVLCVM